MKKYLVFIAVLLFPGVVRAQSLGGYTINKLESRIEIQKDTKLLITEQIDVNFHESRHGIYRYIPTKYSNGSKKLNAHIRVISVNAPYTTGRKGNDYYIKIGDGNKYVLGEKKYQIIYEVSNMITRWEDHDELYWNLTGGHWDTDAVSVRVSVRSPYANITNRKCFAAVLGSDEENCQINGNDFASLIPVGAGSDLTIVAGLDKNNQLVFPTLESQIRDQIGLRWYYILVFIPAILMGKLWWKKGRDITTGYDKYLPYVYAPIKGVSPAQAGILIDQKVNIADMTAEIMELARMKYIQIVKEEKKHLFGFDKEDFKFIKLKEPDDKLKNYQRALMEGILTNQYLSDAVRHGDEQTASLSAMKNNFYKEFNKFKDQVSQDASDQGWFEGSPEKIRGKWAALTIIFGFGVIWLMGSTGIIKDGWFIAAAIASGIICFVFAMIMPRRTAEGHKLYHDLIGLKYYINEGKWRMEKFEKNLFIEEVLPVAIALGVVTQLTNQMKELGMQAPKYASALGPNMSGWGHFNSMAMTSAVASKSAGGWSGGSGFSGGSAGGGGGGGGGGSW